MYAPARGKPPRRRMTPAAREKTAISDLLLQSDQ
jgi:hypothetical protein